LPEIASKQVTPIARKTDQSFNTAPGFDYLTADLDDLGRSFFSFAPGFDSLDYLTLFLL
jgi:hypothetical protein